MLLGFASLAHAEERVRFEPVDVVVTSEARLAAYQVEVTYDNARVKIVGLEGGEAAGWKDAPYYDPKGLAAGRIVIAAFVKHDEDATMGRTRVARLHLQVTGDDSPAMSGMSIRLVTAARPGGERIEPGVGLAGPSAASAGDREGSEG